MANWKETVNIADLYIAHDEGRATVFDIADGMAERLKKLGCAEDLEEQIEGLRSLRGMYGPEDVEDAEEEFDEILAQVYDYGDDGDRLWVETFVPLETTEQQEKEARG